MKKILLLVTICMITIFSVGCKDVIEQGMFKDAGNEKGKWNSTIWDESQWQ